MSNEDVEKKTVQRRTRGVSVIAWWLCLSTFYGIYRFYISGWEIGTSVWAFLEKIYMVLALISWWGLLFMHNWARKLSMAIFILYFFWILAVANYLSGPSLLIVIEGFSDQFFVEQDIVKKVIFTLLIGSILWPIIAALYLSYPGVKERFNPRWSPEDTVP